MAHLHPRFNLRSYDQPFDPHDSDVQLQIHQKLVPLRESPFKQPSDEAKQALRSMPKWLELLFDLAWCLSFSSLSEGTAIKGSRTVYSYSIFFILVWFMWAQQIIYHTRFYTDDVYHRIILVIQFMLFGFVAAFTADFDISVGIQPHGEAARDSALELYQIRSFNALSLLFFMSRFLLMIQYIDVWRFARKSEWKHPKSSVLSMWIATGCSATLFLVAYIIIEIHPVSRPANVIKLVLWAIALLVEAGAYVLTPMHRAISARLMTNPMNERLCTLTIIIIGEGLNNAGSTVVSAARAVGFDAGTGAEIFSLGSIILMIYVLYVFSYLPRPAPTSLRKRAVLGLHLPLHLSIILLLEGLQNILTIYTIQKSVSWLSKNSRTNLFQAARNPSGDVARQFIRAGFNLTDLELKIRPVMVSDESSPTGELEASLRLTVLVFQQLFKTFGILDDALDERFSNYALAPGPQPSVLRDVWIIGNSTDIDEALSRSEASDLIDRGPTREASPLQWAAGIAGGYLVLLAVLMVVNGMPKVRWVRWQVWSRLVVGLAIIIATIILNIVDHKAGLTTLANSGWYLPMVLLVYVLVYCSDYAVTFRLRRDVRHYESIVLTADGEKHTGNPTDGIPLPPPPIVILPAPARTSADVEARHGSNDHLFETQGSTTSDSLGTPGSEGNKGRLARDASESSGSATRTSYV